MGDEIIPLSRSIIVYTVLVSFLAPRMDFVFARIILTSNDTNNFTVAIGMYNMLNKNLINQYYTIFSAAAVVVSIPISVLFVLMQKYYVEGVTGGSMKGLIEIRVPKMGPFFTILSLFYFFWVSRSFLLYKVI